MLMIEVDVSQELTDLEGIGYVSSKSTQQSGVIVLTLKEVFAEALVSPVRMDPNDMGECLHRAQLAKDIKAAEGTIEISAQDAEMIKTLVNKTYNFPLVVAQALEALQEKEG
jgi:hypothetical protein